MQKYKTSINSHQLTKNVHHFVILSYTICRDKNKKKRPNISYLTSKVYLVEFVVK